MYGSFIAWAPLRDASGSPELMGFPPQAWPGLRDVERCGSGTPSQRLRRSGTDPVSALFDLRIGCPGKAKEMMGTARISSQNAVAQRSYLPDEGTGPEGPARPEVVSLPWEVGMIWGLGWTTGTILTTGR